MLSTNLWKKTPKLWSLNFFVKSQADHRLKFFSWDSSSCVKKKTNPEELVKKKIQLGMETEYEYKEENEVVHFTLPSVV